MRLFINLMFLLLIIGYTQNTYAQQGQAQDIKLKIGEQVPNLSLKRLYNYRGSEKTLVDFKGKMLILDFWATWCGPCISAFPKMETLRQKFKDQLQILPITMDSEAKVAELFKNLKKDNGLEMFSLVNDTEIRKLFNFRSLPHYVWIDKNGNYLGDAALEDMTEEKIGQAIAGKQGLLPKGQTIVRRLKDISAPVFDLNVKVLENGQLKLENIDQDKFIRTSTFSKSIPDVNSFARVRKNHFTAINATVGKMFSYLYGNMLYGGDIYSPAFYFWLSNRTIWEVKNKKLLDYSGPSILNLSFSNIPGWESIMYDRAFCYELRLDHDTSISQISKLALNELNERFKEKLNLSAYMTKRKMKCLVLKRTSNQDKIASTTATKVQEVTGRNNTQFYGMQVINKPYVHFIMPIVTLNLQQISTPIVDETGFSLQKIVDIKLEGKLHDWKTINQSLAKYDMAFVESERTIDVVVITDAPLPRYK